MKWMRDKSVFVKFSKQYLNGVRYSQTSKLENYKISNVVICTSDSGRKLYEIEE